MPREIAWKGPRGAGSVFHRINGEGRRLSKNLYLSYRDRARAGREIVISTGTDNLADAKGQLEHYRRGCGDSIPKRIKRSGPKAGTRERGVGKKESPKRPRRLATSDPRPRVAMDERPARLGALEAARVLGVPDWTLRQERDDDGQ